MIGFFMALAAAGASCGDKANQAAMTMCQKAVADQADAEMNRVWKQALAAMQQSDRGLAAAERPTPGFAAALLASQRAWLAFRDTECRIESYEWQGGSMQPFTENQCLTELAQARTRQLRAMLTWDK